MNYLSKPSALGIHCFMGGITCGIIESLDVKAQLEAFDLGELTVEHNLKIPFYHASSFDDWKPLIMDQFAGKIDVVFGNPRCSGFSALGHGCTEDGHGAWSKPTIDIRQLAEAAAWIQPKIWGFESVQQAGTTGRPLLDWLHQTYGRPNGYRFHELYHNAAQFGNAQHRRRVYFVWVKDHISLPAWQMTEELRWTAPHVLVEDVLKRFDLANGWHPLWDIEAKTINKPHTEIDTVLEVAYHSPHYDIENYRSHVHTQCIHNHYYSSKLNRYQRLALQIPLMEGTSLNGVPPDMIEEYDPELAEKREMGISFSFHAPRRLERRKACPVIYSRSDHYIHPEHDRPLTLRELCRFMGLPDDWVVIGDFPVGQIGKGVCTEVGRWLGKMFNRAIEMEGSPLLPFEKNSDHVVYRFDREPGWTPKKPRIPKPVYDETWDG